MELRVAVEAVEAVDAAEAAAVVVGWRLNHAERVGALEPGGPPPGSCGLRSGCGRRDISRGWAVRAAERRRQRCTGEAAGQNRRTLAARRSHVSTNTTERPTHLTGVRLFRTRAAPAVP
jgi:hypothetical protein